MTDWKKQPPSYWQERLTPEEYHIMREAGTERAFTGEYWDKKDDGKYYCRGCDHLLFDSATKYDSGSGWPSFFAADTKDAVDLHEDSSLGMSRTEVTCKNCGAHLGHLFPDGPKPTGERFCMNSASLKFKKRE